MIHPGYIAAAVSLALAGWCYVLKERAESDAADEKAQWAEEKSHIEREYSEAMSKQIEAHNQTAKKLEVISAESQKSRALVAEYAASAVAAGSNAARAERRLRDSNETNRIATAAAIEAAGATTVCAPATKAADLLRGMLVEYREIAGRIGEAGRQVGADADAQFLAATECAQRYDAVTK